MAMPHSASAQVESALPTAAKVRAASSYQNEWSRATARSKRA